MDHYLKIDSAEDVVMPYELEAWDGILICDIPQTITHHSSRSRNTPVKAVNTPETFYFDVILTIRLEHL